MFSGFKHIFPTFPQVLIKVVQFAKTKIRAFISRWEDVGGKKKILPQPGIELTTTW
jgi:hypothetical protein